MLQNLPPELVVACTEYLDIRDAFRLGQTSRVLYDILSTHLWTHLRIHVSTFGSTACDRDPETGNCLAHKKSVKFEPPDEARDDRSPDPPTGYMICEARHPSYTVCPGVFIGKDTDPEDIGRVQRETLSKVQQLTIKVDNSFDPQQMQQIAALFVNSRIMHLRFEAKSAHALSALFGICAHIPVLTIGIAVEVPLKTLQHLNTALAESESYERLTYLELQNLRFVKPDEISQFSTLMSRARSLHSLFIKGLLSLDRANNELLPPVLTSGQRNLNAIEMYVSPDSADAVCALLQEKGFESLSYLQVDDTVFNSVLYLMENGKIEMPLLRKLNVFGYATYQVVKNDAEKREQCMNLLEEKCPHLDHVYVKFSSFPPLLVPVSSGGPAGDSRTPISHSGYTQFSNLIYSVSPQTGLLIS
jgi:uncharacterized protein YfkK (UPF0435 family)